MCIGICVCTILNAKDSSAFLIVNIRTLFWRDRIFHFFLHKIFSNCLKCCTYIKMHSVYIIFRTCLVIPFFLYILHVYIQNSFIIFLSLCHKLFHLIMLIILTCCMQTSFYGITLHCCYHMYCSGSTNRSETD
jgi:hypothetical protein